jgi:hypothetical protein
MKKIMLIQNENIAKTPLAVKLCLSSKNQLKLMSIVYFLSAVSALFSLPSTFWRLAKKRISKQ